MDDIAKVLADFRRSLRMEGFSDQEAFQMTLTYMVELLRSSFAQNASPQ